MEKIFKALEFAAKAHENQYRKKSDIPYISHPCAVGMLLQKEGCSEDVIIAGILHDTIEDTHFTLDDVKNSFGEKIASIVEICSEPDKSAPWSMRKSLLIERAKNASLEIKQVFCADKLHNLLSIKKDYERLGDVVWTRFNEGYASQKWYYEAMSEALSSNIHVPKNSLFDRLNILVKDFFGEK